MILEEMRADSLQQEDSPNSGSAFYAPPSSGILIEWELDSAFSLSAAGFGSKGREIRGSYPISEVRMIRERFPRTENRREEGEDFQFRFSPGQGRQLV